MKYTLFALLLAAPAFAEDPGPFSNSVPPTTLTITFDNLNLTLEGGTIEFAVNPENLRKILENLPANATIVTPNTDESTQTDGD